MKTLVDTKEFLSETVRLEKKLKKREKEDEFPELLKWSIQLLYFDGSSWMQICRIDNHLHEGKIGVHVHKCGVNDVKPIAADFQEAQDKVLEIGKRILKERFGVYDEI